MTSVSYTHLDVYKRQPVNELNPCVMPKLTQIHDLFVGVGELEDLSPIADLTTMPVSYTHLDVYKRQINAYKLDGTKCAGKTVGFEMAFGRAAHDAP